jgi:GntR family transcriptional regulator
MADGAPLPRRTPPSRPRESGRRPTLHALILDGLRDAIRRGDWPVGDLLPSEQDIGERFGASRITVRHALQRLEAEGYVRKQHGRRTQVVSREPPRRPVWQIETLDDIIASAGNASLAIESYGPHTSAEAAEALGLPQDTSLWCLRSALTRDGSPYARSMIYFPPDIGQRLTRQDFDDVIVFRVLASRLGLAVADVTMTVRAGKAGPDDVRQLGLRRGDPLLTTELVYRTAPGAPPVEVAFTRFPADAYSLRYALTVRSRR